MKLKTKLVSALLLVIASQIATAASVIRDGKEWMQLTTTQGLDSAYSYTNLYTNVSSHCDAGTGLCSSGTNNDGASLAGWTWATAQDVRSLFESYFTETGATLIDGPTSTTGTTISSFYNKSEYGSAWAPLALSEFDATLFSNSIYGLTRTILNGSLTIGSMYDAAAFADYAQLYRQFIPQDSAASTGVFLYKNVSAAPVPAALFLFGPALLGFLGLRQKVRT